MDRSQILLDSRKKIGLAMIAAMVLVLSSGLFKLQVVQHSRLAEQSEKNRIRVEPIVPKRGVVVDREGRLIIDNRPSYAVSVVLAEEDRKVTVPMLAQLIGLDTVEVRRRIRKNLVSYFQPAMVERDIPFEVVAVLEEQMDRFPGVTYQMARVRTYSPGLGSEVFTGYVGEVSEGEIKAAESEDYRLGSMIGKKGLERQYDRLMRGSEGYRYVEVTATGQRLGVYAEKQSIPTVTGVDLTLTIDNDLQRICVQAFDTFCCGAVVVIDPRNGELLAMTSFPGYDANIFSSVIPESLWQAISNDSSHPLLNRPLTGLYPPGSVTKLLTIGAALEEGLITPETRLDPCYGGYQFGNRYFGCWRAAGHRNVDPIVAIEQSCDTYLYQVGLKLGVDLLSHYFDLCGFGKKTGIDLPGEVAGLNPNNFYYDKRYGKEKWSRGVVLNLAIGQGEILATPLQLAQFYCGLANNGTVYQPHIVKKVTRAGEAGTVTAPRISFSLPFSEATLRLLKEGLRRVVEGKKGTARRLQNDRYTLGGKTGTAENPHGENHAWFVGIAPLDNPEIVVCAIVENAGHGSEVAAPLVARVLDRYFQKKEQNSLASSMHGNEAE